MVFNIDMKTILIPIVLGNVFIIIYIMAYRFDHKKDKSINVFAASKVLQLISWSLVALRGAIPNPMSISIANSIALLGVSLESIAILMLINAFEKNIKTIYVFLTIVMIFIFNCITVFYNVENIRISVISIFIVLLIAFPGFCLMKNKNSSTLQRIMGSLYYLVIVLLIFRAFIAISSYKYMNPFIKGIYQTGPLTLISMLMMLEITSTGFVILSKEQIDLELVKLASIDELTGILNRRTFIAGAKRSIAYFVKKKEPISFLLIDIDNFKTINDTYGHNIGDITLRDFADKTKEQLREYDLFGRYGGDEFAILLLGSDENDSDKIAERIRKIIEESLINEYVTIKYTVSVGIISMIPDGKTDIAMLYKSSDNALYKAKSNGRNCVVRTNLNIL
ncbi:GGDEF domain-containing protein [Clostridium arbusti]|uniref:GGDEF domain-containing protein n=1 Tax=Clostridium arbusti TaxID=1137848 RepID=UPI000289D23E|nr:GGDEF domain-containing protein [Clostridium arbusti]